MTIAIVSGGRSESFTLSLRGALDVAAMLGRHEVVHVVLDTDHGWWLIPADGVAALHDAPAHPQTIPAAEPVVLERGGRLRKRCGDVVAHLDVVFPTLYGPYGEDGRLQGMLDLLGVACVGTGVTGAAVAMDKDVSKRILRDAGIASPAWLTLRRGDPVDAAELGLPLFVKPCRCGSSVGVQCVHDPDKLSDAIDEALRYGDKVMVEAAARGREIRTALLGNGDARCAVAVGEVPLSDDAFYDYDTKLNRPINRIPADISVEDAERVRAAALQAYRLLDLEGLARIDWFLEPDGTLLFGEANALPCFSAGSMFRELWTTSGMDETELFERLVELALERRARDDAFAYTVSAP